MSETEENLVARVEYERRVSYARVLENQTIQLLDGDPIHGFSETAVTLDEGMFRYLPPTPATKVVGIGKNYPEGEEATEPNLTPSFFLMGPNAMTGHQATTRLPPVFKSVLVEGELGVVIKKQARNLKPSEVQDVILGYTIVNDFSGRDSYLEKVPAAVKKSSDGFAPMGPFLNLDPQLRDFEINTFIDGQKVQSGNTKDMLSNIVQCLCYITSIMTLEPFDVVSTGTPTPKPKLWPGQTVQVKISELGTLENSLEANDT